CSSTVRVLQARRINQTGATTMHFNTSPQTNNNTNERDAAIQIIHTYTRAQAIADGVLVDLMQGDMLSVCRQHFKYPIACTAAVFAIMEKAVSNPRYSNDFAGILHDMLFMSRKAGCKLDDSTVLFTVIIIGAGRSRYYDFKLNVGPGDDAEPVITILLPNED
ncbi:MAG: hypothetical protein PHH07_06735, partial [Candidatus Cloacimonetes bacterium]|nr:hypothetical protein [Candidatus Cloacimonadota bacterium]